MHSFNKYLESPVSTRLDKLAATVQSTLHATSRRGEESPEPASVLLTHLVRSTS